ncbi:MAG TPA: hypothetical protein VG734_00635 [Lacunisphaera sp.]|nr:hypothetical protein [Lacunisphaera sp.]
MKIKSLVLGLAAMLAAAIAPANTVVSTDGNFDGWIVLYAGQAFGVSWTQSVAYENVSISANLTAFGRSSETGRAFLTTSLGPGTTVANQVANASFTFPSVENDVVLFSGLNLSAGQYFLSLVGNSPNWGSGWITSFPPTVETDAAATLGSSYGFSSPGLSFLPASGVYDGGSVPNFSVTGTPVPDSATTAVLAACSLLLLGLWKAGFGHGRRPSASDRQDDPICGAAPPRPR